MSSFINTSITQANLEKGALVLEIGSNDGSVLAELQRQGFRSLGLDPSANQDAALRNGYEVVRDFFSEATAITLRDRYGRPGLILSRHTLEHVFEPMDFMRGIAAILDPDGIAAIEVPYLHTQLINNQFQSMTFQHISFFTATAMFKMASDVGLEIKELTFSQMDGGSIVVLLGHSHTKRPRSTNVDKIMAFEKANKLDLPEGLATYFVLVSKQLEAVRRYVNDVTPGTFVAFGAGSKGQALLNMLKLDCTLLPFVIDETPGTCGRFIPGVGTEITDLTDGRLESSELLLVTAPTHIPEIVRRAATRFPISMPVLATAPALHFVSPIVC